MTSSKHHPVATVFATLLLDWSASATRNAPRSAKARPERPQHMRRKAEFHRNKDLLESDSIAKNVEFFKRDQTSGLRNQGSNVRCNDEEERTPAGYGCSKMDQEAFVSNAELGSRAATHFTHECDDGKDGLGFDYINDIWGYESPSSNKKYAIAGMWDGTSFVDVTDRRNPVVLGFLEMETGNPEVGNCDDGYWRDIKVANDHAYIVSEYERSGIQIFDLARLDSLPRPSAPLVRGEVPRLDADAFVDSIGASHNIIAFPERDRVLVVGFGWDDGTSACSARDGESVAVLDISADPLNPAIECLNLGPLNAKDRPPYAMKNIYPGYVHDGQCFIYGGPDEKYTGVAMCIFFAETEIGIFDMTNQTLINKFSYPGATYVHQGWVTADFTTLYANDEADEECRSGLLPHCRDLNNTRAFPITRIFDIRSLDDIGTPREFVNTKVHPSIDHNFYVKGDYIYSANYEAGARVYEIREDKSLAEVAYFDVSNDCDDIVSCVDPYGGAWTHFPYSDPSTTIASNSYYGLHVFHVRIHENILRKIAHRISMYNWYNQK